MKQCMPRRTMAVTLGLLVAGWHVRAESSAQSSIVVHGAGPTGTIARIAIQLNFQKPETWIYEISNKSVGVGGAKILLQNGIRNAHKPIGDGFVLLKNIKEETESRIEFSQYGIASLVNFPPGNYAAVIEVPSRSMKLAGKFRVAAEGFTNESRLEVL